MLPSTLLLYSYVLFTVTCNVFPCSPRRKEVRGKLNMGRSTLARRLALGPLGQSTRVNGMVSEG